MYTFKWSWCLTRCIRAISPTGGKKLSGWSTWASWLTVSCHISLRARLDTDVCRLSVQSLTLFAVWVRSHRVMIDSAHRSNNTAIKLRTKSRGLHPANYRRNWRWLDLLTGSMRTSLWHMLMMSLIGDCDPSEVFASLWRELIHVVCDGSTNSMNSVLYHFRFALRVCIQSLQILPRPSREFDLIQL